MIDSREPLWRQGGPSGGVAGLAADAREVLVTTVLDARPDLRVLFPTPSIWPFASAVLTTLLFIGSVFTPWAVVWLSLPVAVAMILWFWPRRQSTAQAIRLERTP